MLKVMLLEASHIAKSSVVDVQGVGYGKIDRCVYNAERASLVGFQVALGSLVGRFRALALVDCISLTQQTVVIDSKEALSKDLKTLDEVATLSGPIVGVTAQTESGNGLGTISDLLIDADTGLIVRLYVRKLLSERIIPREYLVAITPKKVIFKDVVNTPVFTQVASAESGVGS